MELAESTFKERLKHRLRIARMTQAGLAQQLGVKHAQSITNWTKRGQIPYQHLHAAAEILECDPDWLQTGKGDELPTGTVNTTVNPEVLSKIIAGTITAVDAAGLNWDATQTAKLVTSLYVLFEQTGEYPASFEQAAILESLRVG